MRFLLVSGFLLLLLSGLWLGKQTLSLRHDNRLLSDTLAAVRQSHLAQQVRGHLLAPVAELLDEAPLAVSKQVREVHRISADYFSTFYLVRLEGGPDSRWQLIFKKCTVQNPLTHEGKNEVLAHTRQPIDSSVVQTFASKLAGIDFWDAARVDDVFCCFGGGQLSLESVLPAGQRLWFSSYCRQSKQFAEACEYILRQVPDPDLQAALKR